jgi:hypothetical protein
MTKEKAKMLFQAGKQLTAIAAGRAAQNMPRTAEEILCDPRTERQGPEDATDPGNPNDIGHTDQQPGQEKPGQ